jgi:hypothetical protein
MVTTQEPKVNKQQSLADFLTINPNASTNDAIKAMKKLRIDVTAKTVYKVKWMMSKGMLKTAEAPAATEAPAAEAPAAEAATGKVSKTQAVKDYLATHRKATPKEISAALKEQGIDVPPTYVSGIKTSLKKKGRRKAEDSETAAAKKPVAEDKISMSALLEAKKLAEKLGGVEKAKRAISALAQLTD